jgi:UDPglucose 6-dehydrogenase
MRIAVVGTGYVGLVAGACLAETGIEVYCVDIDAAKVERLRAGEIPIYEPGLEPLVKRNVADERLQFTTDIAHAVRASDVIFIAVGTPPDEDGSADLRHVLAVATQIGEHMNGEKVVITKSTVPVGTAAKVRAEIEKRTSYPVHVCSNPEFLKEGAAVDDFMKPDRVVVGVESEYARNILAEIYAPFVRTGNPIIFMDVASAEITKYAANAMLATRISFMNMIANLCNAVGANVDEVRKGIGTDSRIGPSFLFAGCGYGGSCFPKDVKALIQTLEQNGVDAGILTAAERVNETQKRYLLDRIVATYGDDLSGKTFAMWGLSFKPETDDMREAPSLAMVEGLLALGAIVRVHDPEAMIVAKSHFGDRVAYFEDNYDVLNGADALVILTEWRPYRRPDFSKLHSQMKRALVFDGRNLFDPERMGELGIEYYSIGRPAVTRARAVPAGAA